MNVTISENITFSNTFESTSSVEIGRYFDLYLDLFTFGVGLMRHPFAFGITDLGDGITCMYLMILV